MAITTLNNRSINRSDTASADQVWTATSATASDFQAGGVNTPFFFAKGSQALDDATTTKLTLTEVYDTDSTYATGTFTPAVAGKYHIFGQIFMNADAMNLHIYKNGANFSDVRFNNGENSENSVHVNVIDEANTTDYYELYAYQASGGTVTTESSFQRTSFGGYKIIT